MGVVRLRKYRGATAAGATYALSKIKASDRTVRKKKDLAAQDAWSGFVGKSMSMVESKEKETRYARGGEG